MKSLDQEVLYFLEEMKTYKYFVEMSEHYWEEELPKYKESLNSENPMESSRFDYRRDLWANIAIEYPQFQRKSYLIMLLSIFEDFLNQFCISVEKQYKPASTSKNKNQRNKTKQNEQPSKIVKLKNRLTATQFSFPSDLKAWQRIEKAQKIRNVIVHAAGYLDPKEHKQQSEIASANDFLKIESYARIHLLLMCEYILELIDDMTLFGHQLLSLVNNSPNHN